MPINPFKQSEESSFEQGLPVQKAVKAVSDQTKQQAKKITQDFVAQLYGTKSDAQSDDSASDSVQPISNPGSPSSTVLQQQVSSQHPGIQTPEEMARYQALQRKLKGEGKSDEEVKANSAHSQNYFRPTIGTLEDQIQQEARKRQQKEQERKKQTEEQEQQKKQAAQEKSQDVPQATGKGRNRMGGKVKTNIALKLSQTKTEMNRGASG